MKNKDKIVDFIELQQKKRKDELGFNFDSDIWEIAGNEETPQKKIRFKIKEDEIETVLYCLDITMEGLSDWIDETEEDDRRLELQERVEFYKRTNSILEDKIEDGTGAFLNISYYDFEIFLCALESEVDGYLDIETRELDINENMDEGFVGYLEVIKKVYDRLNAKYYNGVEEALHPGLKEFRQYAKSFLESQMSNKRDENIELLEKDTELSSFEKLKKEFKEPYKSPKTEEEKIKQMKRQLHITSDDIVVADGDYMLLYKRNFLNLNLVQFDFRAGLFKNIFNINNLYKENQQEFRKTYDEVQLLNNKEKINVVLKMEQDYNSLDFGWMPMLRD